MSEDNKKKKSPKGKDRRQAKEVSVRSTKAKSLDPSIPMLEKDPATFSPWYEAIDLWAQTHLKKIPYVVKRLRYPARIPPRIENYDGAEFQGMSAETKQKALEKDWIVYARSGPDLKEEKVLLYGKVL